MNTEMLAGRSDRVFLWDKYRDTFILFMNEYFHEKIGKIRNILYTFVKIHLGCI